MWEHPFQFPLAAWMAISVWGDRLWQELIGIVGWQDILLQPWVYFLLTIVLLLVPLQKLQLGNATRARVTVITRLVVLGYVTLVYLIFFLIYTPLDVDHIRGVQGRYFVIALPVAAIFIAGLINLELPRGHARAARCTRRRRAADSRQLHRAAREQKLREDPTGWLGISDSNCRIRPRATQLVLRDNFAGGRRKSGGGEFAHDCVLQLWPRFSSRILGRRAGKPARYCTRLPSQTEHARRPALACV